VAQQLALRVNSEVKRVLNDFDRASTRRVAALKNELIAAGFPADGAVAIGNAAINGDPTKMKALFIEHRPGSASVSRSVDGTYLKIATFRKSFADLLAMIEAGNPASVMAANFQAIKDQATNLGASGLADAMTLTQRDLLIRDTVNSVVISSVLNVGQQSLPTGRVTIIRHPWVDGQATYLGIGGLILTRSNDDRIVVFKATAGAALGLPTSDDTPVPDSQLTSAPAGIIISNPATNQTSLSYTLNNRQYTIAPNHTQQLTVGTTWQIGFSPGPNAANKRYSLNAEGPYASVVKNGEWDLQAQEFSIRLHNPANSNSNLNYLVDGTAAAVGAGSTVEHKSRAPLLIRFDRGNGSGTTTKLLKQRGKYYFSLNQASQWDLFQGEPESSNDANAGQLTIMRPSLASLRQGAGTMLFDFTGNEVTPSGGVGLLDALKAAQ